MSEAKNVKVVIGEKGPELLNELVFLDTETTGLKVGTHQVWEIAYAVGLEGPIISGVVSHTLAGADPAALRINHYLDRCDGQRLSEFRLRKALVGATLVASNPSFDRAFLADRWYGDEPWHHRSIAIETMAMAVFGWARPKGLADIARVLELAAPDHSAAGDVHVLREAYKALRLLIDPFRTRR